MKLQVIHRNGRTCVRDAETGVVLPCSDVEFRHEAGRDPELVVTYSAEWFEFFFEGGAKNEKGEPNGFGGDFATMAKYLADSQERAAGLEFPVKETAKEGGVA